MIALSGNVAVDTLTLNAMTELAYRMTDRVRHGVDDLRAIAAGCVPCKGTGEIRTRYTAHLITHDPRLFVGAGCGPRRKAYRGRRSMVELEPRGAGFLVVPCPQCAPIRSVIATLEAD